jgi:hypothetical protein
MLINRLLPMKTSVLFASAALFGLAAFAADPTTTPPKPDSTVTPPPLPPLPNPAATLTGKATVTIDVNGQKVTREVDLSNPQQFKIGEVLNNLGDLLKPKSTTEIRTWLGVATEHVSDEVRAQLPVANGVGLLVFEVLADSPAAKAGLQRNDVLTKLDDQILTNPEQLRILIGMKKDGDAVRITYLRKGQEAAAEVKLATHAEQTYTGTTTLNTVLSEPVRKQIFKTFGDMGNADDPTFASRIYLELLGRPPTPDEIRAFAADQSPDKRMTLVKRLQPVDVKGVAGPIIIQRSAAFDKDGNFYWTFEGQPGTGKDGGPDREQWHLYFNGAHADVTEAMKNLEKSLHDAGLNDDTIAKTRQAVAEAIGQIQKAVSDASGSKDEIQRRAQKAIEEVRRAVENAWRSEEGEASKLPLDK